MKRALALLVLAGLAACSDPPPNNVADNAETPIIDDIGPVANAPEATNDAAAQGVPVPDTLDRLDPLRIGATLPELAREGVAVAGREEPMEGSTCSFATFQQMPDIAAMLDGEKIVRIDVSGPHHATIGGVRVGMAEGEAIRRLGRVDVRPHPYTGPEGHYLIHHREGAPRGLILETDGKTVQTYRFGQWEQVQWIEGCS